MPIDTDSGAKSSGAAFKSGFFGCLGVLAAIVLIVIFLAILGAGNQNGTSKSGSPASATRCAPADFQVEKLKAVIEYEHARLTGTVRHSCPVAIGVELKWTAYNADGSVAFSNTFFPAHTTNIPPNTAYPFETINSAPRGKWQYNVEPVRVYSW